MKTPSVIVVGNESGHVYALPSVLHAREQYLTGGYGAAIEIALPDEFAHLPFVVGERILARGEGYRRTFTGKDFRRHIIESPHYEQMRRTFALAHRLPQCCPDCQSPVDACTCWPDEPHDGPRGG